MKLLRTFLPFVIPFIFFLISLLTIYDYGMNWDSPQHFAKGQAFLRFITTGKKDYVGLPTFCQNINHINARKDAKTGEICDRHRKNRVSEYQSYLLDFKWALQDIYAHPPLSDDILAGFNQLFFVTLGWVEDVPAYHLYSIFSTFILALIVTFWLRRTYGSFAAVIGGLVVYLYPLLLGEQHFNIKDPEVSAFFMAGIFFFWLGITTKKARYLILSAIAGAISFGTKINYVFAPIILLPWLLCVIIPPIYTIYYKYKKKKFSLILRKLIAIIPKRIVLALFLYPCIIAGLVYLSWPSLWFNFHGTLTSVIKYYTDIGVSVCPYQKFTPHWLISCTNPFALQYFLFTTPLITLSYLSIGLVVSVRYWKKYNYLPVLLISFFIITLLRVTLSIASIYGGLRQILEFVGPMAMLAAIGATWLRDNIYYMVSRYLGKKTIIKIIISTFLVSLFIPITIKMLQIHPNENVYFNPLIGGLPGAVHANIEGAGNTYGNAYLQAITWLNKHGEKNVNISLISGLGQNISRASLREDFSYSGGIFLSGYNQKREYAIALSTQSTPFINTFRHQYFMRFLKPVFTVNVDGVPLLEVWHNTPENIKPGISFEEEEQPLIENVEDDGSQLITLPEVSNMKRLEITYPDPSCDESFITGEVYYSLDNNTFTKTQDNIDDFTPSEIEGYKAERVYLFAGNKAKFIKIIPHNYKCNLLDTHYKVFVFKNL